MKLAFGLAALLLLGAGCSWNSSGSYTSPQQNWSDMTDEQRAQVRSVLRTFGDLKDKQPDEIRAIEPLTINVMQIGSDILPFPEQQFTIVTPVECPDDCTGDHYVGSNGLTLDLRKLSEPAVSCEWGAASSAEEMEVDHEILILWLEEYEQTR